MSMKIYRLIVHHETPLEALEWIRKKQVICIGWGKIGDISGNGYRNPQEIGKAIKSAYPERN